MRNCLGAKQPPSVLECADVSPLSHSATRRVESKHGHVRALRKALLWSTACGVGAYLLGAQETTSTQSGAVPTVDWSTVSDMQVLLRAVEQLPTMPATNAPRVGTFWSAQHLPGASTVPWPPLPANVRQSPFWDLGDNVFLLDDFLVNYSAAPGSSSVQKNTMAKSGAGAPVPNSGSGGSGELPDFPQWSPPTNGALWLEITNVADGLAFVSLHNATNYVYEIFWKTNLLEPVWNIASEVFPADTNCTPFNLTLNPQPPTFNLFLWARDWTGVTSGGNQTPEWWFWKYFGTVNLSDTNLDSQGQNTLLYDYTNNLDPNVISFTVRLGNQHFHTTNAAGGYLVLSGIPGCEAVLINNTNFAGAVWQPYDGIVHLNLGPTDGVYQVWMGLKGRATDAQITWFGTQVTLTRTLPQITITNPTNAVVAQPWLQLQGFSAAPLAQVTCDLNGVTNLPGAIIASTVDPNTFSYTTDYFQCYDLRLTNGPNNITLHATDPAGNTFTTNFTVTLDYSAASVPMIQLTWPQNGMEICGSSFTLRGWTEDAAATVTAQITDTNGDTTTVNGLVERTGVLWADNLPLAPGTNVITLWVTNAAGLSSETNLSVVKSDMTLTLDNPAPNTDLWLPTVNVTGRISDPNAPVWVNGVEGTNHGDGTWSADHVPVTPGGVASFDLTTIPPDGSDPSANVIFVKWDKVELESATWHEHFLGTGGYDDEWEERGAFSIQNGGSVRDYGLVSGEWSTLDVKLAPDQTITWEHVHEDRNGNILDYEWTNVGGDPFPIVEESGAMIWHDNPGPFQRFLEYDKTSDVKMALHLGGRGRAGSQVLIIGTAGATELWEPPDWYGGIPSREVPKDEITDGQLGPLDAAGYAYAEVADGGGATVDVTPQTARSYYSHGTSPNPSRPQIYFNGRNVTDTTTTVIVGQPINLTCGEYSGAHPVTGYSWNVPGYAISNFVADANSGKVYPDFPLNHSNAVFYWVDGGNKHVSCDVTVDGKALTAAATFNVLRPAAKVTATTSLVGIYDVFNPPWLEFFDENNFREGITLSNSMVIPSGFSGANEWVQIVNPYRARRDTNDVWWVLLDNGSRPYLDTSYPYTNRFGLTTNVAIDSPGTPLSSGYNCIIASDKFTMWLMFKPTDGRWVPLRMVNWHWNGTASLSGTNWVLTSSSWSTNPPDADAGATFPQWNSNVKNLTYQKQP